MKFIVTAGGQGTKVWPMSREDAPKQFQNIVGDTSLYKHQIETLLKGYAPEDIFISTKEKYVHFIEEQSPQIPQKNIIIEPNFKKNRGPGEGYAFLKLAEKHPNEPFMLVQADVLRDPAEKFLEMIAEAERLQKRDRKFITAGQKATTPTLGIDYMRLGDRVQTERDVQVYKIDEFIERPNEYQKTKDLVENFNVSTHANHLCWYPEHILEAYQQHRPDWYDKLMEIKQVFGSAAEKEKTNSIYQQMDEGATEEVTKHVMSEGYSIITPFKWIDVGTWSSIYETLGVHGENYIDAEESVTIETERTMVKGQQGKLIATLGVEDLVVVDTPDALLVMSRERAAEIKKILQKLEESGNDKYL